MKLTIVPMNGGRSFDFSTIDLAEAKMFSEWCEERDITIMAWENIFKSASDNSYRGMHYTCWGDVDKYQAVEMKLRFV